MGSYAGWFYWLIPYLYWYMIDWFYRPKLTGGAV